ncbi:feruloyl-CoA synthase [Sulfitobacter mediterraneus]|uniref:feruloyl-CoA synthase n=1 Tax=Sulfitobacter mediterraneus TaxID=83219 RepID=UPI0019322B84|nr:feruloyl-CoA synthase [Sulfitobacter mediterraneus]MBM1633347.1 feruloyl-CoA synthase [Sulfitobacter mediterraneus]MBM1640519.1 feruloyl-CoA synthase [Sulfitobacter mediterraneus]MBM1645212.1 feruloyl-CoA synthase [Sulfitobacter mediterraneus]MBM1648639.1 feruloyl-CoA synthase [Sulfitobacter mediterraneus]MBM1652660.1 feruloyl-CoA synthase [Sulfitobacter mediterraneus]
MTAHLGLKPHQVLREDRANGAIVLQSGYTHGPVARCTGDWLDQWADATPDALFLAERSGTGWRKVTYGAARDMVRTIAGHLLNRDLGPDRPVLIISGNSIDHALLSLAAQYVGIPVVPVAEQYALIPAAHGRLIHAADMVRPGLVYASDASQYGAALDLEIFAGVEKLSSMPGGSGATDLADLMRPGTGDVQTAADAVTPETLAKILLTSGSTSDPKGVLTTQRMMTTNQAQVAACLPFLAKRPPRLVDWLPWNHTFGGSYNFNLVLANGGSMHLDDGKPAPGLFDRTRQNLAEISATISFNVPVGFAQLVTALKADKALRETYFADLDMIFYAGASLPQDIWMALEQLALDTCGQLPLITTSWGLTETAPGVMISHEPAKGAGLVGVPMPGCTVKLVPDGDGRFDVRVKGDNVTPGYLNNPEKTQEAFDGEGYFITGDAMQLVAPADADRGLMFDGRISENFKLMTGTWVRASQLRLDVLAALAPLAQDVVITGEDRSEVGVMILPNRAAIAAQGWTMTEADGVITCAPLQEELGRRLSALAGQSDQSTHVSCALVLSEPASMAEGEATAKGNINFPKFLRRRADLVDQLYDPQTESRITTAH